MDIYSKKSRWKLYLAIAGVVIVLISLIFTRFLTDKLAEEERKKIDQIKTVYDRLSSEDESQAGCDVTFLNQFLEQNTSVPILLVNDAGDPIAARNFGDRQDTSEVFMANKLEDYKKSGLKPTIVNFYGMESNLYFEHSKVLTLLTYYPLVQLLLISAFILFGYLAFSSARRAEENRVWVGMAKETAHQLGTPISGILGWINHIQMIREDDEEMQEIVTELGKDVNRLELVADRFSKIGSAPELVAVNAYEQLEQMRIYMQRRAPRKVKFHFPSPDEGNLTIHINAHLFDWVVENLIRNALDSMGGKGDISAEIYDDSDFVYMDITDTGGGIPEKKFKTVFRPGFTTKKRGWGLGLSLAKRIIEEYHSGKIFVKKSVEGEGTTFTIQMPKKV